MAVADNRILYNAFNIYYEKGMDALKRNQYEIARRNILASSETLYKIAKDSQGELKNQRLRRADELYQLASEIEKKQYHGGHSSHGALDDLAKVTGNSNIVVNEPTHKTSSKSNSQPKDEELTTFQPVGRTGVTLDDVAGLNEAKDEIRKLVVEPQLHPEIYKRFKKNKGGGILLYGVPGTGKTMLAKAIASELDAEFYSVKCSDIASKWFGDSEQNIKNLFKEARSHKTSIIFFDEFEALGTKRDTNSTVMKRVVPELLAQMQGFEESENTLLLIAATNRPWDIDSAFLRPGRFNTPIYVPLPDYEARKAIITKQLQDVPLAPNFSFKNVINVTEGFNGSDVTNFCDRIKDYAIERSIQSGTVSEVNNNDVTETARKVHTSVQASDLEKMVKYQNETKQVR